jgi:DNA-binding CsgD family transcriptional regulator/PAS domain-containing protein
MRTVLPLIDAIYEAVLDTDKWSAMLEQAADYFSARGAQIGNSDLVNSRLSFSLVHGYDWSAEHILRYEALMGEDPRLKHFSANPFKAVHCRMLLTEEELHSSRVYKEVLSVGGVEYSMGVNFIESDRAISYFLLLRDATMSPFSQQDCERLAVLVPHLARALRLQRELDTMSFEKEVGFGALDSMALGVVIADENGHIKFANAMAENLLERRDGLSTDGATLQGMSENGASLVQHIRTAIDTQAGSFGGAGRAFRLLRARTAEPYLVVASSIAAPASQSSWKPRDARLAVLFIRDPEHAEESRVELLQRLYGLTGSEARLSDLIALGMTLKKGAEALGLTEASAREYIKRVFRKTGVHSQPDLVRKVMSLPPGAGLVADAHYQRTAPVD